MTDHETALEAAAKALGPFADQGRDYSAAEAAIAAYLKHRSDLVSLTTEEREALFLATERTSYVDHDTLHAARVKLSPPAEAKEGE